MQSKSGGVMVVMMILACSLSFQTSSIQITQILEPFVPEVTTSKKSSKNENGKHQMRPSSAAIYVFKSHFSVELKQSDILDTTILSRLSTINNTLLEKLGADFVHLASPPRFSHSDQLIQRIKLVAFFRCFFLRMHCLLFQS